MIESIKNFFTSVVGPYWSVFICSMIPIIELRGAIPIGAFVKMHPLICYLIAVTGNMLPVPFVLLLIKKIIELFKKSKIKFLNKFANFLERRTEKNKDKVIKYGFWGIVILVAIPLPGTGAWTGSLISALLDIPFWKAMLAVFVGVLIAGVAMLFISYGASLLISLL